MWLFVFRWSTNLVAESQQFVVFTTEQVTQFQQFQTFKINTKDRDHFQFNCKFLVIWF